MIWNRNEYYNLIFAVFHLWPLQLLINNPVFIIIFAVFLPKYKWIILSYDHRDLRFEPDLWPLEVTWGQKYIRHKKAHTWLPILLLLTLSLYLVRFSIYWLQSFQGLTLTFDLWRSPEVENILSIRKPLHDFLSNFYWHFLSISYRFWDIRLQSFQNLILTFDLQRSQEVKKNFTIRKPIHDFLSNFYWHFLSISYSFRDIRLQSFEGLTLTFVLWRSAEVKKKFRQPKAHIWLPI